MSGRALVAVWVLFAAPSVRASTLGLLRCTNDGRSWASQAKRDGKAATRVIRDREALGALWQRLSLRDPVPAIDFGHDMILVLEDAPKEARVIYRVQLDDSVNPRALEVHVAGPNLPCGNGARTPDKAAVHLVQTRRSLLPVRFVADEMVDGRLFVQGASKEGVDETELAVVAPPPTERPAPPLPITTREGAEQRVVAALTQAERALLSRGPLANHPMKRIPHGWTELSVTYASGIWTVRYDTLTFVVDAATGAVTRSP